MTESTERIQALHREVLETLVERADGTYRIDDLVTTGGTLLGVRVPEIRSLAKDVKKRHSDLTPEDAVALLDLAFSRRGREEILFGLFLLAGFRRLPPTLWARLEGWLGNVDNWETCDQLAIVAGGLVAEDLGKVDDLVAWAESPSFWRRRFAAAVTTDLNHKGRSHPDETFRVLGKLVGDSETMVQKAVAWALREVSKQEPRATFDFLEPRIDDCSARVLREGTRKLPEDLRDQLLEAAGRA